ncbi:nicotinamide N-methyltransferase [Mycena alexandri]|uniref:Protein N-terminal and lysine N-methyltransferase EFM7 n=1 Tax=Mycena alexandri TaxID=1745969 RepID=A0AAD6TBS4_9AGAR|nr:nicotinamide N-methyltransferase [Mycena alexandri]
MEDDDDIGLDLDSVFPEEERPPTPEATVVVYEREERDGDAQNEWREVKIRLVGAHPLWGHHLWNAARAFASYLDAAPELYRDRSVLELGAGGGLPGLVAALNGAGRVVLTDYPDAALIANLEHNVEENVPAALRERVDVKGYIWGQPVQPLLDGLRSEGFQLIIMSDLVFNHSQHDALLQTCEQGLASDKEAVVLVFYTHHRPHLAHRDMEFFAKARERGWMCGEILRRRFAPMFPEDSGSSDVRATVAGWELRRSR